MSPRRRRSSMSRTPEHWWRRSLTVLPVLVLALALGAAGCGDDDEESGGGGGGGGGGKADKVAVLLPDSKSSVRWETVDRPFLKQAFDSVGVPGEIQNAEGDKSTQQQQAEQAITKGAKVILLTNQLGRAR